MNPANPVTTWLFMEGSAGGDYSGSGMQADFVPGGVKMRGSDSSINSSSFDHLSAMWGRPIGGVCVAPATAR